MARTTPVAVPTEAVGGPQKPVRRDLTPEEEKRADALKRLLKTRMHEVGYVNQDALAAACGITQGAVSQFANKKAKVPLNPEAALKLARNLKVEPGELHEELRDVTFRDTSNAPVDAEACEFVRRFKSLPSNKRDLLRNILNGFESDDQK